MMNLSDRAEAILNFKLDLRGSRDLFRQLSVDHGCAEAKWHYHEVHLYCQGGLDERKRLLALSKHYRLWADRFRITHERREEVFAEIAAGDAREELMLGTHWFMPVALADVMAAELLAVADQMDIAVERIRVERPMGRSPALLTHDIRRGWWEAHLSIAYSDALFDVLPNTGIRDISRKIDFITGECLSQGFVNIEVRDQPISRFAATCAQVAQLYPNRSAGKVAMSLEEVLIDFAIPISVLPAQQNIH